MLNHEEGVLFFYFLVKPRRSPQLKRFQVGHEIAQDYQTPKNYTSVARVHTKGRIKITLEVKRTAHNSLSFLNEPCEAIGYPQTDRPLLPHIFSPPPLATGMFSPSSPPRNSHQEMNKQINSPRPAHSPPDRQRRCLNYAPRRAKKSYIVRVLHQTRLIGKEAKAMAEGAGPQTKYAQVQSLRNSALRDAAMPLRRLGLTWASFNLVWSRL